MPPAVGKVSEPARYADIGVTSYQFPSGVRLNVKPTDFQAHQVQLSVQFGRGKQAEPAEGMAALPRP